MRFVPFPAADPPSNIMQGDDLRQLHHAERLFAEGDYRGALAIGNRLLPKHANHGPLLMLRANAAIRLSAFDEAIPALKRLHAQNPHHAGLRRSLSMALNNRGSGRRKADMQDAAKEDFEAAIAAWPENHDALFNMAQCELAQARFAQALPWLEQARRLRPNDAEILLMLAKVQVLLGNHLEAHALGRALKAPLGKGIDIAAWLEGLADMGKDEQVADYFANKPDGVSLDCAIAAAERLRENANIDAAKAVYTHAAHMSGHGAKSPGISAAIATKLALSPVYADAKALTCARDDYRRGLDELLDEYSVERLGRCEKELAQLAWCNFLVSYHGENNLALQKGYGLFLERALSALSPYHRERFEKKIAKKGKIGFVTSGFRYCTVGSYFGSWPRALKEAGFEVAVFQLGPYFDATTERIAAGADMLVKLEGPLANSARQISEAACDLLIYPDLGMDPRVLVLAAHRLAPKQAMAWGHPDTSGLKSIDYYFSCETMEPENAQAHYSEELLLLPGLGTQYALPEMPPVIDRASLGLLRGKLYLVPQSVQKIHPDFDEALAQIAVLDPQANIVLFNGERPGATQALAERMGSRLEHAGADRRQLRFLPLVSRERYLQVARACDVMVDSMHWSGGNTAIDAILCGLPLVTLPGKFMRGRQSLAMLRRLGLESELVCDSAHALARRAVEVANDGERRRVLADRMVRQLPEFFDGRDALARLVEHARRICFE